MASAITNAEIVSWAGHGNFLPNSFEVSLVIIARDYLEDLISAILITTAVVNETSFSEGHEHVHIRVHIPHLINEVHHQKKIIHHTVDHDRHDYHHDHHGFDDFGGGYFGGDDFGGYGEHEYP